ncbi:MAG: universal stress protein [Desulfobulbaceae bacterium]|nr:universal stress protein [Desulfobulbaceae bacterium]
MERKILVAVEGSQYSHHAVTYLCQLFADIEDVYFDLLAVVPCSGMTSGKEWLEQDELINVVSPQTRQKYMQSKAMVSQFSRIFEKNGVDQTRITSTVKISTASVAFEIMHFARQGLHDALVIGRRGLSKIQELIMGSVSQQILEKCSDVPIWIIDGEVDSNTFFVPVDGTPFCLKAIDHLAFILKGHPRAEVTLFNSKAFFTKNIEVDPEVCHNYWGKEWCEINFEKPDSLFHAPRQMLVDAGFPEERIHTLQTKKGLYPSRQIVRQALMDGFGTIVIGRKEGLFKKEKYKGVSDRVVAMAVETAIWVV